MNRGYSFPWLQVGIIAQTQWQLVWRSVARNNSDVLGFIGFGIRLDAVFFNDCRMRCIIPCHRHPVDKVNSLTRIHHHN